MSQKPAFLPARFLLAGVPDIPGEYSTKFVKEGATIEEITAAGLQQLLLAVFPSAVHTGVSYSFAGGLCQQAAAR